MNKSIKLVIWSLVSLGIIWTVVFPFMGNWAIVPALAVGLFFYIKAYQAKKKNVK